MKTYVLLVSGLLTAFFTASLTQAQPAGAEPVGMVMDVQGRATVRERGSSARIDVLSYLRPQTDIELAQGASLVVTWYASSVEYRFSGPARLKVHTNRIEVVQGGAAQQRSLGEDSVSAAKRGASTRLAQAAMLMRGMRAEVSIVSPAKGTRIMTLTPRFVWNAPNTDEKYQFILRGSDSAKLVEISATGDSLQLQESKALEWGKRYRWTLQPQKGKAVEGDFETVSRDQAEQLARLRPDAKGAFSDWVLYAATLEDMKLSADAQTIWKKLSQERPEDANLKRLASGR